MNSRFTGGMIRPYDSKIAAMNRLLDGFIIAGSLEFISFLYAVDNIQYYHLAALLGTVFFLFLNARDLQNSGLPLCEQPLRDVPAYPSARERQ